MSEVANESPRHYLNMTQHPRNPGFHGILLGLALTALSLWPVLAPLGGRAAEPDSADVTNTFPSVAEVIGGRTFENLTEEDIFFLRAIHDHYSDHWSDLLEANIIVNDYVLSPAKFQRFVDELGEAMRGQNDPDACKNLALITGNEEFYGGNNAYRPEIFQAAARALIKIGPDGRKALARAFTESHYRENPASLADLAEAIGEARLPEPEFIRALAATAFDFSTTNGAIYPHCTTSAVKNLLCLEGGPAAVREHARLEKIFDNPGRFQSVVDGIAAAHASELTTNLVAIQAGVRARLAALANSPGGYKDDLHELEARLERTLANFEENKKGVD